MTTPAQEPAQPAQEQVSDEPLELTDEAAQIADLLGETSAEEGAEDNSAEPAEPEPAVPAAATPVVPAAPIVEASAEAFVMPEQLPDDPAELKKLLAGVGAHITALREQIALGTAPAAPVVPAPVAPAAPVAPTVVDPKEAMKSLITAVSQGKDYLTKEDVAQLDGLVDNPALLHPMLNGIIARSQEAFAQMMIEALPAITGNLVDQHTATRTVVDNFYKDNKDLEVFRPYVKTVTAEILAKEPNLAVKDMLEKTAAEVRKRLRLPAPVKPGAAPAEPAKPAITAGSRATKPSFAQQRRGAGSPARSTQPKAGAMQQQIKDLL